MGIEVGFSIPAKVVIEVLKDCFRVYGIPRIVRTDQGPEFAGKVCDRSSLGEKSLIMVKIWSLNIIIQEKRIIGKLGTHGQPALIILIKIFLLKEQVFKKPS